ncbi:MAG: hypothetical protein GKC08_00265 [Methanosarcinales archaeon]|nr:hypothetical protein [Methanosarcinales archaeon]
MRCICGNTTINGQIDHYNVVIKGAGDWAGPNTFLNIPIKLHAMEPGTYHTCVFDARMFHKRTRECCSDL